MKPKEVAVLSGKGGTGKITVTAALAKALRGMCVICDADVDVPDLWILLKPAIKAEEPFMGGKKAFIKSPPATTAGFALPIAALMGSSSITAG
ncbi:MAG: P-loop NTPase [Thermanaerothrix sp.]|nr:P-loop NTPase [Thermanaerothrix sp.]